MDRAYLKFSVDGQIITRTDSLSVVGDTQNYHFAEFSFSKEWDGLRQTAVFRANGVKPIGVEIRNGQCEVPWEVLMRNEFFVGVFAGERITTNTVRVPVGTPVSTNSVPGVQPTPSAYELLVQKVEDALGTCRLYYCASYLDDNGRMVIEDPDGDVKDGVAICFDIQDAELPEVLINGRGFAPVDMDGAPISWGEWYIPENRVVAKVEINEENSCLRVFGTLNAFGYAPARADDFKELFERVYGVHPQNTMLFDSKADEFATGLIMTNGTVSTSGNNANRFYIPMVDISSGSVKVQIKAYQSNDVATSSTHAVWIAQYDADGTFVSGSRKNISTEFYPIGGGTFPMSDLRWIETNNNGFGVGAEATITPAEGAVYANIYNFYKGVDIDMEVFIDGADSGGVEPKDGIVDEINKLREDMEQLVPKYRPEVENAPLIATVFGKTSGNWYTTDFSALVVADMHGAVNVDTKFISLDDAAIIRDACVPNAVILNAGDNFYGRAKENGVIQPHVAEYMEKAKKCCVYHTMGQHELGWSLDPATDTGGLKANCMTHDEVFQTFIEPMKSVWGLSDLTTNYYYKDFTAQKTRLISLYQYNVPLVDDETDSTRYKYNRNTVWLGQEQLDWLVNTLNTVPDGYKVIILQHQLDRDIVVGEGEHSAFHDGETSQWYGGYISSSKPVVDIVGAFINKTSLNKTYPPSNTDKHPADVFTVTVSADFTNATGEFANYLSGDVHFDFVGFANGTRQRHISLTACNTSYDCYVDPKADGAHRSIVNLLGYDYKNGFIRLGRVGQQYSLAGQTRVFEKVKL